MSVRDSYLIVTDPGLDDAIALAWLISETDVSLEGIVAVAGNVNSSQALDNACLILAECGADDIPLYQTIAIPQNCLELPEIHGELGMAGFAPSSGARPQAIRSIEELRADASLAMLNLSPCKVAARLKNKLGLTDVWTMGGTVTGAANTPNGEEFNFRLDPRAAADLLSGGGEAVNVIPWEVSRMLGAADALGAISPSSGLLHNLLEAYLLLGKKRGHANPPLHDLVAACVTLNPHLCRWSRDGSGLGVGVEGARVASDIDISSLLQLLAG